MSDAFRVDIPALPGYERAMQGAPNVLAAEMLVAARRISAQAEGVAKVAVPVDTGHLKSTIYSDAKPYGGGVQAFWGASADYALPVDKGHRAGNTWVAERPYVTKAHRDLLRAGVYLKEFGGAVTRTIAKIVGHG